MFLATVCMYFCEMCSRIAISNSMFLHPNHNIEPHAPLLKQPESGQALYKIISGQYFLDMLKRNYLYFRRVDTYQDNTDGEQLLLDKASNEKATFAKDQSFSLAKYYDTSRARTYACCFSLSNSDYIWNEYGNGGKDAVCLVFDFDKLRTMLNQTIGQSALMCGDNQCHQIFSINYGIVEYADRNGLQLNGERFPNPIQYTYIKGRKYENEAELRISLSTLGMGNFALSNSEIIQFPTSLQVDFNFKRAFVEGAIKEILYATGCDQNFPGTISQGMEKLGFLARCSTT